MKTHGDMLKQHAKVMQANDRFLAEAKASGDTPEQAMSKLIAATRPR